MHKYVGGALLMASLLFSGCESEQSTNQAPGMQHSRQGAKKEIITTLGESLSADSTVFRIGEAGDTTVVDSLGVDGGKIGASDTTKTASIEIADILKQETPEEPFSTRIRIPKLKKLKSESLPVNNEGDESDENAMYKSILEQRIQAGVEATITMKKEHFAPIIHEVLLEYTSLHVQDSVITIDIDVENASKIFEDLIKKNPPGFWQKKAGDPKQKMQLIFQSLCQRMEGGGPYPDRKRYKGPSAPKTPPFRLGKSFGTLSNSIKECLDVYW